MALFYLPLDAIPFVDVPVGNMITTSYIKVSCANFSSTCRIMLDGGSVYYNGYF